MVQKWPIKEKVKSYRNGLFKEKAKCSRNGLFKEMAKW